MIEKQVDPYASNQEFPIIIIPINKLPMCSYSTDHPGVTGLSMSVATNLKNCELPVVLSMHPRGGLKENPYCLA